MTEKQVSVTAVVLAYGPEPLLQECVTAILSSTGVNADVVLVDNGCTDSTIAELSTRAGVRIIRPTDNVGFAGGCNLGVEHSTGEVLALVNSDAVVEPTALSRLAAALYQPGVGLASGSLRLYDAPSVMNSAGNPVHYLGISWAGALGEPAADYGQQRDVASATGAAVAVLRERWSELGGFWEDLFAYCEDVELSLRCWQSGLRVVYVPDAVVLHRYEFSRNPFKMYLLERNRLLLLLTIYEGRTLLLLAPAMLCLELVVVAVAARQGWLIQKARGWQWIVSNRRLVRRRRAVVQGSRTVTDRSLARHLTAQFSPGAQAGVTSCSVLNAGSRAYWAVARRLLA